MTQHEPKARPRRRRAKPTPKPTTAAVITAAVTAGVLAALQAWAGILASPSPCQPAPVVTVTADPDRPS